MAQRYVRLYEKYNDPKLIEEVVQVLNDGGVVIYPSGTTYAFGCNAMKERAVERICELKGISPAKHPLSIICYDLSAISEYAKISTPVFKVMKQSLPGPFTFILPGKNILPKIFRNKRGEVGIRMPDSPIVRELLEALGQPLMTASLPVKEDEPECRLDPELAYETFGNIVDCFIDGGMGREGVSTVVDCTGDTLDIIRQGDGIL